jgi:hypothetical protein
VTVVPAAAPARKQLPLRAALIAALIAALFAGTVVVWWLDEDEPEVTPEVTVDAGSPGQGWPQAGASRTVTEVASGGTLRVKHWIHASQPLEEIELELPDGADNGDIGATAIEVLADGQQAYGPEELTDEMSVGVKFYFARATRILVRYQLDGAVELSTSAPGRGLATTTALEVSVIQPTDTRVVRARAVLSLACAAPAAALEPPEPCGESDSERQWRVELSGQDAGARVVASVTVP